MSWWLAFLIWIIALSLLALAYLNIAVKYRIVDIPNDRSSHAKLTVRGGGIIIWVAILAALILGREPQIAIIAGLLIIGFFSFLDDIKTLSASVRFIFQLISVYLLCYSLFPEPTQFIFWFAIIVVLANVNCYNFMDGINGLSGFYSLLAVLSILLISANYILYWQPIIASLLVFLYFNAREKGRAKWFGGDIGSIVCGYLVMYLIFQQIFETGQISHILIIGVYGVDGGWTLFHRLVRRENIFSAHRSHLYQYLANERKMKHLTVSGYYISVQSVVNFALFFQIKYNYFNDIFYLIAVTLVLSLIYHYFAFSNLKKQLAS
jgi:UDP-N-acetylmuramyl pentapeptide phosphotransferase/UDP-N-acetylglucosamine-1-phosphate transferase